ncbi:hypothetical protein N657DRAFT_295928 [Parathielavia appendiculata]|uniref:Uncharacterized protein n=1 Tax=Parathielavia appendiculata TaxID=2587402 RepID=A0AAN6U4D4_9PEZI|nr:hypothetical protein N657DRAFT_295928 [Parathielavia appendiculata]
MPPQPTGTGGAPLSTGGIGPTPFVYLAGTGRTGVKVPVVVTGAVGAVWALLQLPDVSLGVRDIEGSGNLGVLGLLLFLAYLEGWLVSLLFRPAVCVLSDFGAQSSRIKAKNTNSLEIQSPVRAEECTTLLLYDPRPNATQSAGKDHRYSFSIRGIACKLPTWNHPFPYNNARQTENVRQTP